MTIKFTDNGNEEISQKNAKKGKLGKGKECIKYSENV